MICKQSKLGAGVFLFVHLLIFFHVSFRYICAMMANAQDRQKIYCTNKLQFSRYITHVVVFALPVTLSK